MWIPWPGVWAREQRAAPLGVCDVSVCSLPGLELRVFMQSIVLLAGWYAARKLTASHHGSAKGLPGPARLPRADPGRLQYTEATSRGCLFHLTPQFLPLCVEGITCCSIQIPGLIVPPPISMRILRLCHHSRPSDCTTSYASWSIARVHRNLPRRPAPASRTHGTQAAEAGRTSRRGLSLRRWQPNHSSLELRVLQDNMS